MSRIAIFIDGAYLDYALRDEFNSARIDYHALAETLAGGIDILRTYYYHCLPYQSAKATTEDPTASLFAQVMDSEPLGRTKSARWSMGIGSSMPP